MVPDIFPGHWWHREQHLPGIATWFYLTNSHTVISNSPVLRLDHNASSYYFTLFYYHCFFSLCPFIYISVALQIITLRDHKILPPVNTCSQKSISKEESRIYYRISTCFLLGLDCKSPLFLQHPRGNASHRNLFCTKPYLPKTSFASLTGQW